MTSDFSGWQNSVRLIGRVTSAAEEKELPSGETLVRFRMVVPRAKPATKVTVDTIDCVSFEAGSQRTARSLSIADVVEILGELRRRFCRAGTGVVSRVEVEVTALDLVKMPQT